MVGPALVTQNLNNTANQYPSGEGPSKARVSALDDQDVVTDNGWGWVVVLASFFIHVLIDGLAYTFGIFTTDLVEHYDISRQSVGWINSALVGLTFIYGLPALSHPSDSPLHFTRPLWAHHLANLWSHHAIGHLQMTLNHFVVPRGLGCGLAYLPTICIVTEYFRSKRALALGFAVCGSGIGTFLFAPLLTYLINIYSWRGAMLLEGGLILNGCVCGAAFRPLKRSPMPTHLPATSHKPFDPTSKRLPEEGEGEASIMPNGQMSGKRVTKPARSSSLLRVSRPLVNAFSLYLLANATFLIFATSNFLTSLGFNAPFLFATDRAIQMGVEESRASFLVAAIGIGNTLGRVAFGVLAMTRRIRIRLHLYNGSLVICGLITAISCWAVEYPLMIAYYLAFGFFSGSYVTLFSVLLADLLGAEFLKDSFGLSLLIMGVAVIVGPPIAGTRFGIRSKDHLEVSILIYNRDRESFVFVKQFRPVVFYALLRKLEGESVTAVDAEPHTPIGADGKPVHLPSSKGETLELCAGIVDKAAATLEETAVSEIHDECGYRVNPSMLRKVTTGCSSVGLSGTTSSIFYVEVGDADLDPNAGGGNPEEGEFIEVIYWPLERADELLSLAETGTPVSATVILAVLWFQRHILPSLCLAPKG
ncbi:unnamed protein product [Taenia asiatica]|uniref:Uridine diphosphate glucose pyrophosphatase NUDT14 n=1 Tax=Taenia asiatica TaxID=60517 RepID=A0A0R3VWR0_TAEAS|nr:unnamed protein product [Taenia asiatica]